nr:cyclic nucleotide-gated cation channel beta-1-like [Nicotiana tomentosiformis]
MTKASQTPSKAKSSTKVEAKPKIMKPKSKKNAKPSREPTPTHVSSPSISSIIPTSSSHVPIVHVVPIIPTSIVSPPPKITTHAPELPAKNTSKLTKFKATPRKSVKKGESVSVTTDQVQHPPSKLYVLVSDIDVAPLDTLPPTSENPPVEKFTVEKGTWDMGKEIDTTAVEPVVEGEVSKKHVQKEASNGFSFSWAEDEEDDGGEKEEEAVNSHEEHDAQNIANEEENSDNEGASGDEKGKEENHSEEEKVSKSEGEDQEKISESKGGDEESEEEEGNVSEESDVSMTIENTVIAPSEETGKETRAQELGSLLTLFTGDEEVSSDVPLFECGYEEIKAREPTGSAMLPGSSRDAKLSKRLELDVEENAKLREYNNELRKETKKLREELRRDREAHAQ